METTAYINGKIFTSDKRQPWAEAFLVEGGKFIKVGTVDEILSLKSGRTRTIDLQNATIIPGIIDSHVHMIMGGASLLNIDLTSVKTAEEFILSVKNYVAEHRGQWILGGNWNQQNWPGSPMPEKSWIDEFTPDTPVFLQRMDYHMGVANSAALFAAGITKDTISPEGGSIEKDTITGEPTGILKDKAMELVYRVIPKPTFSEKCTFLDAALSEAARLGVTSVHDITYKDQFDVFQEYDRKQKLTCRIYSRLPIEYASSLIASEISYRLGSPFLRIGSLKAFSDGSLGSATAWFFEPYSDEPGNFGLPMDIMTNGFFCKTALEADRVKLQLSVHAIGDRANFEVLDVFSKAVYQNPQWDRRFRIEHAQHIRESDIPRFKELGVIASMQPYHLVDDGVWAEKKIGPERMKLTYAFGTLMRQGVHVSFGSDWPVVTLDPLKGIYSAVNRITADGKCLNPDERINVEQAVLAYTITSAYAAFSENETGSISEGKHADFIILSDDIFSIPPEQIRNVHVVKTVVDGITVFE